MTRTIAHEIVRELVSRGYASDGNAPNGTMGLDESYLSSLEIGELLDILVRRRERISRSVDVVGQAAARQSHDDVVIAIDAVKAVVARLVLP